MSSNLLYSLEYFECQRKFIMNWTRESIFRSKVRSIIISPTKKEIIESLYQISIIKSSPIFYTALNILNVKV